MFKKLSLIGIFALILAGCSTVTSTNVPVLQPYPDVFTPSTPKVSLGQVQWTVYNSADIEQLAEDLKTNKKDVVIFALTQDGYKVIESNIAKIQGLVKSQKNVIIYLKTVIKNRSQGQPDPKTPKK